MYAINTERDKEMGASISAAEENIKDRYPALKDKNPLRLVFPVGFAHDPERYTAVPCSVHDLTDSENYEIKVVKAFKEDNFSEEVRHMHLSHIATATLKMPKEEVDRMSLQELEARVRQIAAAFKEMMESKQP